MKKAKFNKDEKILHVTNAGTPSKANWVIEGVEVFSCGVKQLILKKYMFDGIPWKGDKFYADYSNNFEMFFKIDDVESAESFRLKEKENSNKIEMETAIRLGM